MKQGMKQGMKVHGEPDACKQALLQPLDKLLVVTGDVVFLRAITRPAKSQDTGFSSSQS